MKILLVVILMILSLNLSYSKVYDFSEDASNNFLKQYHTLNIPSGAIIFARLNSNISSETNMKGEEITTQLVKDWMYKDKVVAPEGSLIKGKITSVKKSSLAVVNGKVYVNFYEVIRPDGSVIRINTKPICLTVGEASYKSGAKALTHGVLGNIRYYSGSYSEDIIRGAVTGGVTYLLTQGEEVNIPYGTEFRINIITNVVTNDYEN